MRARDGTRKLNPVKSPVKSRRKTHCLQSVYNFLVISLFLIDLCAVELVGFGKVQAIILKKWQPLDGVVAIGFICCDYCYC